MTLSLEIECIEKWPIQCIGFSHTPHGWRVWWWRFAFSYSSYNLGTFSKLTKKGILHWTGSMEDYETVQPRTVNNKEYKYNLDLRDLFKKKI